MSDELRKWERKPHHEPDADTVPEAPGWKEELRRQAEERRRRAEALTLEYRGYRASCRVEPTTGRIVGHVTNTSRAVISFEGRNPEDMERAMIRSVDDYLAFCSEEKIQPERPRRKNLRA
jgi:hypothetical protein